VVVSAAAGPTFNLILYSGNTATATVSTDANTFAADASPRWIEFGFPDAAFVPGTTYSVSIQPTTTNNVTVYSMDCSAAGHLQAFAGLANYRTRLGAGNAAAATTTRLLFGFVGICASESASTIPTGSYEISGTVTDGGVAVSGATVRVIDRVRGLVSSTTTNGSGIYAVSVDVNTADQFAAFVEHTDGGDDYQALAPWGITAVTP